MWPQWVTGNLLQLHHAPWHSEAGLTGPKKLWSTIYACTVWPTQMIMWALFAELNWTFLLTYSVVSHPCYFQHFQCFSLKCLLHQLYLQLRWHSTKLGHPKIFGHFTPNFVLPDFKSVSMAKNTINYAFQVKHTKA